MTSPDNLRRETVTLLRRFAAAQAVRPDAPFHCCPIEGYSFAWILHPGFDDGTRMSGLMALSELEQAGLLAFDDDGFPTRPTTFSLTAVATTSVPEAQRDFVGSTVPRDQDEGGAGALA